MASARKAALLIQYPLPSAVGVRLEALGTVADSHVAGLPAQVHVARLREPESPVLCQPTILDPIVEEPEYSDGTDPDDSRPESPWGYATSWGSRESTALALTRIVISFDSVEPADCEQVLAKSMKALPAWFALLKDWCEILTLQDLDYVAPRRRIHIEGDSWSCWHGDRQIDVPQRIIFDLDYGEPLAKATWEHLLMLVGSRTEPAVEYLLVRDARAANARGQYRRVVVDAATALEIALHRILLDAYRSSPTPLGSELLRMTERWTLGRLVDLLARLGDLPVLVTGDLVNLRNDVIHKEAKEPTEHEAEEMLQAAADAVATATPLPTCP